jgi:hypothetical protein
MADGAQDDERVRYMAHRYVKWDLGMPADATLIVLLTIGREVPEWKADLAVRYFYVKVDSWDASLPQPLFEYRGGKGEPSAWLVCLAAHFARVDAPGVTLAFWWPWTSSMRATRLEILGWDEPTVKLSDLKELMNGVPFVRKFARAKSGPKDNYAMTLKQFEVRALAAYCELIGVYDDRLKDQDLADRLGVSVSTFRRRKEEYRANGGDWPPTCPDED